jgi:DNA processing protein
MASLNQTPMTSTSRNPDDLHAWLRLAFATGVSNAAQRALLKAFGSPQGVLSAKRAALAGHVSTQMVEALLGDDRPASLEPSIAWLAVPGNHLVTLGDPSYPRALFDIADPPIALFAQGRLDLFNTRSVAVVGSRNATPQGKEDARAFARALSDAGLCIVSGLAQGIDAAAHRGGLEGASSSIAVVGTGLDIVYPAANSALARELAQRGLVVSEFPIGARPLEHHFPRRNRIISGLSRGVLVVEAAMASGSLITARLAGEQGRDVFAIPGSIHSPFSKGCHRLIRQGAKLVESAADVLEELAPALAVHARSHAASSATPGPAEDPVLAALGHGNASLDALCARTGLAVPDVSARLSALEIEGRIARLDGGRFQRLSIGIS